MTQPQPVRFPYPIGAVVRGANCIGQPFEATVIDDSSRPGMVFLSDGYWTPNSLIHEIVFMPAVVYRQAQHETAGAPENGTAYATAVWETDAEFRPRLLTVARGPDRDEIQIAGPERLDQIGEKYGLKRFGRETVDELDLGSWEDEVRALDQAPTSEADVSGE